MKTVKDMYIYTNSTNKKLLSNFPSAFWQEYILNSNKYDKLFCRMFLSYRYFLQDGTESINDITDDFIDEVYNHLLVNDKKYSELYRVNVLDDDKYSITDNYSITETMDRDVDITNDITDGARTDTSNTTYGSQTNTTSNKISPYDSEGFYNDSKVDDTIGSRVDSTTNVKGEQNSSNDRTEAEDYTLKRSGNIGIKTVSQMLTEHTEYWNMFEFYSYIFKEIAKELLLV